MKKLPLILSLLGVAFLFPNFSHAQSILLQQPNEPQLGNYATSTHNVYQIGQGNLIGQLSTSSIYFSYSAYINNTGSDRAYVQIAGYSDPSYSVVTDSCDFYHIPSTTGLHDGGINSNFLFINTGDCLFEVDTYVLITYNSNFSVAFYGLAASVPPFELVSTNFDGLTPTIIITGENQSYTPILADSDFNVSGAISFCNSAFGTSTSFFDDPAASFSKGFCIAIGFLLIPSQSSIQSFMGLSSAASERFPFSWLIQTQDIIGNYTASSSENFFNLQLDFGTTTQMIGIGTLTIISTTTISKYMSDSQRNAIKLLLSVVFYMLAASFIYKSVQNVWHKQV